MVGSGIARLRLPTDQRADVPEPAMPAQGRSCIRSIGGEVMGEQMQAYNLAAEIKNFLYSACADHGTYIDSGAGNGSADLWVTVGGVEFFITVQKSNNQKAVEAAKG